MADEFDEQVINLEDEDDFPEYANEQNKQLNEIVKAEIKIDKRKTEIDKGCG